MIVDYVTIFDKNYLPQGISMVTSLLSQAEEARVWVVAADDAVSAALAALNEDALHVVPISQVETDDLRHVKSSRSRVEFYWTLTPFLPSWVFAHEPEAQIVVYVDADMYFFKSPVQVLDEFLRDPDAGLMITPHDYSPECDQTEASGVYCVQFMPFRRGLADEVLKDWQDKCLEWCFARAEPGRFGDQKYLDQWPSRFPDVTHVQKNTHLLGAPWNASKRDPVSLVAFHFHGLRRLSSRLVALHPGYSVPGPIRRGVYAPYLQSISQSLSASRRSVEADGSSRHFNSALLGRLLKDVALHVGAVRGMGRLPASRNKDSITD
jgi:hypothetical protein